MESEAVSGRVSGRAGQGDTQLDAIRDLMAEAATHGAWLTLGEIAEHTQFGEASISAQLRHLRKPKHGHYCVAKRIRTQIFHREPAGGGYASDAEGDADHVGIVWEYRIVPITASAVPITTSAASVTASAVPPMDDAVPRPARAPAPGGDDLGTDLRLFHAAPPEIESAQARESELLPQTREGGDPCQSE